MNALTRRRMLSGALACTALAEIASRTEPAKADLFGGDVAVLVAILTQSISTASSLVNLVLQTANQVRMMTTMLQQVSKGSFPAMIAFINAARSTFNTLTWGVRSMSYQIARIDSMRWRVNSGRSEALTPNASSSKAEADPAARPIKQRPWVRRSRRLLYSTRRSGW